MQNTPRFRVVIVSLILVFISSITFSGASGWSSLFDGKTMNGWKLMAVHGGHGGVWEVKDGALVGDQEKDHQGGLIGTEKKYGDFEIEVEFKADLPVDTGLFLRTREDGMGYQITIDYRKDGTVGSLYAPAEGGFIQINKNWEKAYKKFGWNKLRARIEGQPAHVRSWLNDKKMIDFTDNRERFPAEGYIGLQVHGGEDSWGEKSKVRYRNIRIREIPKP